MQSTCFCVERANFNLPVVILLQIKGIAPTRRTSAYVKWYIIIATILGYGMPAVFIYDWFLITVSPQLG